MEYSFGCANASSTATNPFQKIILCSHVRGMQEVPPNQFKKIIFMLASARDTRGPTVPSLPKSVWFMPRPATLSLSLVLLQKQTKRDEGLFIRLFLSSTSLLLVLALITLSPSLLVFAALPLVLSNTKPFSDLAREPRS